MKDPEGNEFESTDGPRCACPPEKWAPGMSIQAGSVRRSGETTTPTREVSAMPKVRVHNVTISLDGFAAGTNQRLDAPFGDGVGWGDALHSWFIAASEDAAA